MRKHTFPRWLAMVFGLAVVILLVGGVAFYRAREQEQRQRAEAELLAIARLKANQIAGWRAERLGDAAVLMESPFFAEEVARWMASPEAEDTQHMLTRFRSVQEHYHYQDVLLVDAAGQVRLSLSGNPGPLHADEAQMLATAWRARQPVLTDLRDGSAGGPPHLDAVAPLVTTANAAAEPVGAAILQVDARQFLYPLIESWPTPSGSAETLLVRRDGEDALFLNNLRHEKATALTLRIPLSRTDMPAVQAVLGREGVLRGRDYRGVEVLSALKAVPDSPWFLVAKVDTDEVFAVWRFLSVLILTLIVLLAVGAVVVVALIWQRNEKTHYRAQVLAEMALRASEERYRTTLMSVDDAVIVTDAQGRVELLNPAAEVLTGWRQAEATGRTLEQVFHIINEETRQVVENPVLRVLGEGLVVGLANHTLLIARDGTERPIADAGTPIRDAEGHITGVVLVFRDQTAARAAQQALNASEIRYRRLFEAAKDGILILAADTGIIIDVNPFLADLLGFSREQVQGKTLWELGFFKDIAANQAKFVELWQKEYVRYEDLPLETADGRRLDVEFVSNLYEVDHQPVIQCNIRDITVRKQREQALRKSEARLRLATSSSNTGLWDWDLRTNEVYYSPIWKSQIGYEDHEISNRFEEWQSRVHPDDLDRTLAAVRADIEKPRPDYEVEFRFRHKDGSYRWILARAAVMLDEQGTPCRMLGSHIDITDRKQAGEALRSERDFANKLVETAQIIILLLDTAGRIVRFNSFMEALSGYRLEEVKGKDWFSTLLPSRDRDAIRTVFRNAINDIQTCGNVNTIIAKDGREILVEWHDKTLKDADGNIVGLLAVGADITERKQAEESLRASEEQLRQAQKMEAVGQLAAGVAHDLNNTLTAILGYVDLARRQFPAGHAAHASLDGLEQAATQAAGMSRGLLTFSGRTSPTKKPVALGPVLTEAIRMLRHMLPASIELVADVPPDMSLAVCADSTQIQQVLMNLALNARDAMPEGGQLDIALSEVQDTLDSAHVTPSRLARITVRDNGVGIPPGVCARIFEPFFTTKVRGQGAGLGLAIVHGIVRDHGGRIEVDSEPGRSTTMTVLLPAVAPVSADVPAAAPVAVASGRRAVVLLAEDQEHVRRVVATTLEATGYEVVEAVDGEELQQRFSEASGRLRLLIFDIDLPKRSGRACLRDIRAAGSQTPAILITGKVEAGLEEGLDEHTVLLRKPFRVTELAKLAGHMLTPAWPTEVQK